MGRPRKVPDPNKPEHQYLLKHIPAKLWLQAQTKALEEGTSMRAVLVALIQAWVEA